MINQTITLTAFGYFGKSFLDKVAEAVKYEFPFPVRIIESHVDLAEYFDPSRRQYDGNKLLKSVNKLARQDTGKTIGLFDVDLYIPILTYIFGQAILNGETGIASTYRLSNEHYGLEPDHELLLQRFTKVVIHELGHAFGLIHCTTPTCVMRPSTYVEDIDQKGLHFCQQCKGKL
ncbi:MAG: archaemetzincin family Zn-dependent metalloprotease [Bacteroidales bacterium]|nr:archaemetzincin family Zn-dependent metalloprotease [Bacteroidales bacterium]